MCGSGVFFPPTGLPPIALLGPGMLLSLAILGSMLWLATHWLSRQRAVPLPYALPHWEPSREDAQGYSSHEPKQEYEQPGIRPSQEMPSQW